MIVNVCNVLYHIWIVKILNSRSIQMIKIYKYVVVWLLVAGCWPFTVCWGGCKWCCEKVKSKMDCNKFISIQNQVHMFMYFDTTIIILFVSMQGLCMYIFRMPAQKWKKKHNRKLMLKERRKISMNNVKTSFIAETHTIYKRIKIY